MLIVYDPPTLWLLLRLPKEFRAVRDLTLSALWRSPQHWEI
jgi:phosphoenolpyruvate carboxykinase (GTP)